MIRIDEEQVEGFIRYANIYLGRPQISLEDIRYRQDDYLNRRICRKAMDATRADGLDVLTSDTFFAGSVDFMAHQTGGGRAQDNGYYVLETNGGSSRGYAVMPPEAWAKAIDGYIETLKVTADERPLVLIGHPASDLVLYEKVFLAEAFSSVLRATGRGDGIVMPIGSLPATASPKDRHLPQVVIGSYGEILPRLTLDGARMKLDGRPVSVVAGDGLVRRHKSIAAHLLTGTLETIVVNDTFHVSDDKALTYHAVQEASELLSPYGVIPIKAWRATDRGGLHSVCREALKETRGPIVIKPHGGSGGSGIDVISDPQGISRTVEESVKHYRDKFGADRDPFPYTVTQLIDATPCEWKGEERKFDVRVYVARSGGTVEPLGGLVRIARTPFTGVFDKSTFVVNLSGYGGVDTGRGLGVSEETFDLLGLDEDDFVRMFSAATALTAHIGNNHEQLGRWAEAVGIAG